MLHLGCTVLRPGLAGKQVGRLSVSAFSDDTRQRDESYATKILRPYMAPELVKLVVFGPHPPRTVGPCSFNVPALYRTIDGEGRKQCKCRVRQRCAKALFIRETSRAPMPNGSAERESLEHVVFMLFPGIEAHAANDFRLVGSVVGQDALAVERAHPVLHGASGNVSVNRGAGAAVGGGCRRVQQRCHRPFDKVDVGHRCHLFLCEWLLELAYLDLESWKRLDVHVEVAKANAVTGGSVNQHREVIVLAVVSLKAKSRLANQERVRRH